MNFFFDKKKFKKVLKKYFPKLMFPAIEFHNGPRGDDKELEKKGVNPKYVIWGDFDCNLNKIRIFRLKELMNRQPPKECKSSIVFIILHELGHWQCYPGH